MASLELLSLWILTEMLRSPGSLPDFPRSSRTFPEVHPFEVSLGSLTPSDDSQQAPLIFVRSILTENKLKKIRRPAQQTTLKIENGMSAHWCSCCVFGFGIPSTSDCLCPKHEWPKRVMSRAASSDIGDHNFVPRLQIAEYHSCKNDYLFNSENN